MNNKRLEFALERLTGSDWQRFEQFASEYLSAEYPDLRTLAATGDKGRDAILFSPQEDETQVLQYSVVQYSVAQDWKAKLHETLKKLSINVSGTEILIYVTNQVIGADADTLRREARTDYRVHLTLETAVTSWNATEVLPERKPPLRL